MSAPAMRAPFPSRQRGFTLLEVLVAFAIMGLSLGVLYQVAGGALRNTGRAELNSRALMVAESALDLRRDVPAGGWSDSGSSADGLQWRLQSEPYPVLNGAWPLYRVQVEVSWGDFAEDQTFRLARLYPEAAPPRRRP